MRGVALGLIPVSANSASGPLRSHRSVDVLHLPRFLKFFGLRVVGLRHRVAMGVCHSADGLADLVIGREAVLLEILGHLASAHVGLPVVEGLRLAVGVGSGAPVEP